MTNELLALLRRVEAAGGPVRIREYDDGERYAQPRGLFGDPDAWGPGPFVGLMYWSGIGDAIIIQALKLDAQQRDARLATDWLLDNDRWMCGVSTMRNYGGGQSSESTMSLHEDEATAHCLAWLDAFEDKQETTR